MELMKFRELREQAKPLVIGTMIGYVFVGLIKLGYDACQLAKEEGRYMPSPFSTIQSQLKSINNS